MNNSRTNMEWHTGLTLLQNADLSTNAVTVKSLLYIPLPQKDFS